MLIISNDEKKRVSFSLFLNCIIYMIKKRLDMKTSCTFIILVLMTWRVVFCQNQPVLKNTKYPKGTMFRIQGTQMGHYISFSKK